VEQLPEDEAGRPRSDDRDLRAGDVLCTHGVVQ
jgi:hypothetical protein